MTRLQWSSGLCGSSNPHRYNRLVRKAKAKRIANGTDRPMIVAPPARPLVTLADQQWDPFTERDKHGN